MEEQGRFIIHWGKGRISEFQGVLGEKQQRDSVQEVHKYWYRS